VNRFEASLSLRGLFSGENKKPTWILLLAPFLLTGFKYYGSKTFYLENIASFIGLENREFSAALFVFLSSFFWLGVVPYLIVRFLFREELNRFGVGIGDWRFGLKAFAVMAPVMILLTYPSASMPQFLAEYPLNKQAGDSVPTFLQHAGFYLLFYAGWEFFFRGFMQFGLRERLGDWNAILVQTLASCLLHIGKPDSEIFGSILGGIVWGIVVFRSRSLLYVLILHWLLGVSLDAFILFF
jgi:membrane protease YdiL (CAAX protease family)